MKPDPRIMARLRQSLALFNPPEQCHGSLAKHPPKRFEELQRKTREAKPEGAPP